MVVVLRGRGSRGLATQGGETLRALVERVRHTSLPSARCYPIKGTNVCPLATPQDFYEAVMSGIKVGKILD